MSQMSPNESTPNLASVLKALSESYASIPPGSASNGAAPEPITAPVPGANEQSEAYVGNPASNGNNGAIPQPARTGHSPDEGAPAEGVRPSPPQEAQTTSGPTAWHRQNNLGDPSTITTWSTALKYVVNLVGKSEAVQQRLRRLIDKQHELEKQCLKTREGLVVKIRDRSGKRKQLDDVLKAIGGTVSDAPDSMTPEDEAKELARHDARTYGELVEFSRALDRELCLMGVPFFATKFELVKPPDSPVDPTGKTIRVQELGELQKKMLTFLEELVSE